MTKCLTFEVGRKSHIFLTNIIDGSIVVYHQMNNISWSYFMTKINSPLTLNHYFQHLGKNAQYWTADNCFQGEIINLGGLLDLTTSHQTLLLKSLSML